MCDRILGQPTFLLLATSPSGVRRPTVSSMQGRDTEALAMDLIGSPQSGVIRHLRKAEHFHWLYSARACEGAKKRRLRVDARKPFGGDRDGKRDLACC